MLPKPRADLKPNTPEFERLPLVKPTGFREYDARWLFPQEINLMGLNAIGLGIATLAGRHGVKKRFVVGHDYRSYSASVKQAVMMGLIAGGAEVHDIGLAMSPMAYFAQFALDVQGVAMITASHNDNGWTGIKMGFQRPLTFGPELMSELKEIVLSAKLEGAPGGRYVFVPDIAERYMAALASRPKLKRKLKVVAACGNGTAGAFAPRVLEAIGCEVVPLDCELDYTFPRYNPNPEDMKMLHAMSEAVTEHKADAGLRDGALRICASGESRPRPADATCSCRHAERYIKALASRPKLKRKLKVVAACGNGTAGAFAPTRAGGNRLRGGAARLRARLHLPALQPQPRRHEDAARHERCGDGAQGRRRLRLRWRRRPLRRGRQRGARDLRRQGRRHAGARYLRAASRRRVRRRREIDGALHHRSRAPAQRREDALLEDRPLLHEALHARAEGAGGFREVGPLLLPAAARQGLRRRPGGGHRRVRHARPQPRQDAGRPQERAAQDLGLAHHVTALRRRGQVRHRRQDHRAIPGSGGQRWKDCRAEDPRSRHRQRRARGAGGRHLGPGARFLQQARAGDRGGKPHGAGQHARHLRRHRRAARHVHRGGRVQPEDSEQAGSAAFAANRRAPADPARNASSHCQRAQCPSPSSSPFMRPPWSATRCATTSFSACWTGPRG